MNLKALLTLLASIIFIFGADWWYGYKISGCRQAAAVSSAPVPAPISEEEKEALMFSWSKSEPTTYDKWADFKTGILDGKTDDNILEITGRYFKDETAPPGYDNMGLARAAEIRSLFPEVPDTRIRYIGELADDFEGMREKEFSNASFKWLDAPKEAPKVIETPDGALVYFPFNSSTKRVDQAVDDKLKEIAELLKPNEKIIVTGHTDNIGDDALNMKLSEQRAKFVQNILEKYGVPADQITTNWKGESEPAESNDTERGRQNNRRTVVKVIR